MPWRPNYITVELAEDYLKIPAGRDPELATWVPTVSRLVDKRCNRQFGRLDAPATFTYAERPFWEPRSQRWLLPIDDVCDAAGLMVNGTAYADQSALLWPLDAIAKGGVHTHLSWTTRPTWTNPYTVASRFGWLAYPDQVSGACLLQIGRLHARKNAPFGVAGSPATGSEVRLLQRLDPDVAVTLAGLARPRAVG